jgi:hypothetical protein
MTNARASIFAVALCACGGSQAASPPPSVSDVSADSGAESFAEVHADDVAALEGGGTAAAPAAETAPETPADAEPPDECAPVAVELEKSVRPELKACYREGKKKEPNLEGTVRIGIEIDTLGKVKSTKIIEKTLPDKVAQCMLKAVKAAPKTELSAKCPGKSLTIPVTFPTP